MFLRAALSRWDLIAIVLAASIFSANGWAARTIITHPLAESPKEALQLEILKLAIEKSGYGQNYQYEPYPELVTETRMVSMVNEDALTVMWAGTQREYESILHPVRVPLFKGLLGHRIFIIRQGDQSRFDDVNSLADLKEIPLGQGRFWGDTVVLKNAGMKVVDPVKYENLFPMLEGGRFDFFPRAVQEPWSEIKAHRDLNLTVEENILLIYPFAAYFFVSIDNKILGNRIESGFRAAIDDGSFDQMFFNHPMVAEALDSAKLKQRKIIRIHNPNMTAETPTDEAKLWLNIENL